MTFAKGERLQQSLIEECFDLLILRLMVQALKEEHSTVRDQKVSDNVPYADQSLIMDLDSLCAAVRLSPPKPYTERASGCDCLCRIGLAALRR